MNELHYWSLQAKVSPADSVSAKVDYVDIYIESKLDIISVEHTLVYLYQV